MVIAFFMPEIEGSCCVPWPLVVENQCLGCSLLKQMLLWSMYFLCSMFFYVLSSFSKETGTFQTPCSLKSYSIAPNTTPCSLKSYSIAPNAIRVISPYTRIVDCQSLNRSASYVLPMFEIRIPCIHIKTISKSSQSGLQSLQLMPTRLLYDKQGSYIMISCIDKRIPTQIRSILLSPKCYLTIVKCLKMISRQSLSM
jgi:hypothetical protein